MYFNGLESDMTRAKSSDLLKLTIPPQRLQGVLLRADLPGRAKAQPPQDRCSKRLHGFASTL